MAGIGLVVIVVVMFAVFYFFILRPQRRRQVEHQKLIDDLNKGDKIITIGGIMGEVDFIGENDVILRVEDGSKLKLLKNSIMVKQVADEGVQFDN